jgi:hypothetical protein
MTKFQAESLMAGKNYLASIVFWSKWITFVIDLSELNDLLFEQTRQCLQNESAAFVEHFDVSFSLSLLLMCIKIIIYPIKKKKKIEFACR